MTFRWLPASRAQRDRELDEEVRAHLRMAEADRVARGETPATAAVNARREFGNVGLVKEVTREMWGRQWFGRVARDITFGVRMLRRSPGVALLAILCLTVAIGANAAVYSWIEGILLRPYPLVAQQERLFALAGTARGAPGYTGTSWPDFTDLQRTSTLVEAPIANNITGATLSVGDRADRAVGGIVSANYFTAIGVRPLLGRGFERGEDVGRNAHPVVVISYRLWQERFNGDPRIIGRAQMMDGVPHTIVGVTPDGFVGTFVGYAFQFWVPASQEEIFDPTGYKLEDRGARWIEGMVRLKPGVTMAQAQAELTSLARRFERAYPTTNRGRGFALVPLWKNPFNNAGALFQTLRITVAVASLVLLIACANVGNLLLARAIARRREMMVRLAIGAGRVRLVTQMLTEGLILSVCASIGGLLVAYWCRHALVLFFPSRGGISYNFPGTIDWRVLALSAAVCVTSTVLFALVPAMQASAIDLGAAIKAESVVGGRAGWMRSGLVLVQVSLSFVLLVGTGLLIQSLHGIRGSDPGFSIDRQLLTSVNLTAARYDTARGKRFQDAVLDRVRALGGVESAAYARIPPFSYIAYSSAPIAADGREVAPDEQPTAEYDEIGPDYLATVGIPLASGREFTVHDAESSLPVAVVNETLVIRFWPGMDPIGKRLRVGDRWMQVVGVARNAKYGSFLETPKAFFYVPLRQNYAGVVTLAIRTTQRPDAMAPAVARAVHEFDPNLSPGAMITMRDQVDRTMAPQRAAVALLEVFGGVALLLAAVGLYGVMAYAVSQRTRELGLRMALGAGGASLLRLVMTRGLALTAAGVVLGVIAALGLTRALGPLLYDVSPRDPLAFGLAGLVMAVVAVAACLVPARRAARIDPIRALRQE